MAKTLAIVFGAVFVLVALLGFVNSPIAGETAIFQTNALHDLVHLLFGLILLGAGFAGEAKSALWLKILGIVYLVLALLGFLMIPSGGELLDLVLMNTADHWLHVVLGVALIVSSMLGGKRTSGVSGGMPMSPSM